MAFGFESLNENGISIIDGSLANYQITQKGSFYATSASVPEIDIGPQNGLDAQKSLLFFSPPGPGYFSIGYRAVTTTSNLLVSPLPGDGNLGGFPAGTWYYFIAKPVSSFSGNAYGLQIINPSGVTILDSGHESFGIDGGVLVSSYTTYPSFTNASFDINVAAPPSGKRRYILAAGSWSGFPFAQTNPDGFGLQYNLSFVLNVVSATTARYHQYQWGDSTGETGGGGIVYYENFKFFGATAYL